MGGIKYFLTPPPKVWVELSIFPILQPTFWMSIVVVTWVSSITLGYDFNTTRVLRRVGYILNAVPNIPSPRGATFQNTWISGASSPTHEGFVE